jgi:branched-subunit amino acid ABC-type transport system permease component
MSYFLELLINGALTGLMYSMVALGIVLIYKSSGVLNFAQGALVMIGGYAVWLLNAWGLPIWLAALAAVVVMFVFGLVTERLLLRTMVGQPIIMVVMLTLGLDVFLRGFGPGLLGTEPKQLDIGLGLAPLIMGDILANRTYVVGGAIALVLVALALAFFRTRLGASCARCRTTTSRAGRWASRWSTRWPSPGAWPASAPWPPARCGARRRAWTGRSPRCCSRPWRWSSWAASTASSARCWAG